MLRSDTGPERDRELPATLITSQQDIVTPLLDSCHSIIKWPETCLVTWPHTWYVHGVQSLVWCNTFFLVITTIKHWSNYRQMTRGAIIFVFFYKGKAYLLRFGSVMVILTPYTWHIILMAWCHDLCCLNLHPPLPKRGKNTGKTVFTLSGHWKEWTFTLYWTKYWPNDHGWLIYLTDFHIKTQYSIWQ